MNPSQYVKDKAAASGSSFYYAFLFLPKERREAITAFYAFCREVDDVVDDAKDMSVAAQKLSWWRSEVHQAFLGKPSHPVMQALMPLATNYRITESQLTAVITGCEMDLSQTRYLEFANLKQYCHLVAGVVGEVAAQIFGQTQEQTTEYAHTLGLAFQLTNIIRDVGEDLDRGRIYLPIAELQSHGVTREMLEDKILTPQIKSALKEQIERVRRLQRESAIGIKMLSIQSRACIQAASELYCGIVDEVEKIDYQIFSKRAKTSNWRRMKVAIPAYLRAVSSR